MFVVKEGQSGWVGDCTQHTLVQQYAQWVSAVGRSGDGRVLRMVIECMSGQPPPLAQAPMALKLHIQCPRLGVRVAVDESPQASTVSLQLLHTEAWVCGTGDVRLTVGSVRLGADAAGGGDGGNGGDGATLLQVCVCLWGDVGRDCM